MQGVRLIRGPLNTGFIVFPSFSSVFPSFCDSHSQLHVKMLLYFLGYDYNIIMEIKERYGQYGIDLNQFE